MKTILSLLIATVLIGCADTNMVMLDASTRAPSQSIQVFKDGVVPTREFEQIAEVSWKGPRQDELRAQKHFMLQAQKLGGNAILFLAPIGDTRSSFGLGGGQTETQWLFKAKVLVWK